MIPSTPALEIHIVIAPNTPRPNLVLMAPSHGHGLKTRALAYQASSSVVKVSCLLVLGPHIKDRGIGDRDELVVDLEADIGHLFASITYDLVLDDQLAGLDHSGQNRVSFRLREAAQDVEDLHDEVVQVDRLAAEVEEESINSLLRLEKMVRNELLLQS